MTAAVKDLWSRMRTVVEAMQTRLGVADDGKPLKFHDTLVTNIEELLSRVPQLNLTGDADIEAISAEMRDLVAFEPSTLREDVFVRNQVADRAKAIAARMKCFVGE